MYFRSLSLLLLPATAQAVNVVLGNDDGWAEINIRQFYDALTSASNSVVLSAPADNESGTGSLDAPPRTRITACEFNSCPANSPPTGTNASQPSFHYVNSYPVTAIKYGLQNFSSSPADIVVTGPNVGANLGLADQGSGTVGAATEAVKEGVPAIAFSGTTGSQTAWNVQPVPDYAAIYADLATNVTEALIGSGKPYLPSNVFLNVNFPAAGSGTSCTKLSQFKFVLSRINTALPFFSGVDVTTCNNGGRLPTENDVVGTDGCYASISPGHADSKLTATAAQQQVVLNKLGKILSCLPS
ncbi:MAG: hypothetical protein M1820_001002 [Bogoriella megaspora]|nr:MAG: hypothetical protein M1820_001002 [Bogoriella megaspora]